MKPITIEIHKNDGIPAFGAWCAGSMEEGQSQILLNVKACLSNCVDEYGNEIEHCPKEKLWIIIETLMHEFGHALQEFFDMEFTEEKLEEIIDGYMNEHAKSKQQKGKIDFSKELQSSNSVSLVQKRFDWPNQILVRDVDSFEECDGQTIYVCESADFLEWVYDRLICQHKENPLMDYMIKFKDVIKHHRKMNRDLSCFIAQEKQNEEDEARLLPEDQSWQETLIAARKDCDTINDLLQAVRQQRDTLAEVLAEETGRKIHFINGEAIMQIGKNPYCTKTTED